MDPSLSDRWAEAAQWYSSSFDVASPQWERLRETLEEFDKIELLSLEPVVLKRLHWLAQLAFDQLAHQHAGG